MNGSADGRHADAFVGRREELAMLQAAFERHERIVTLVGPPGIGKTRLALEYVRRLSERSVAVGPLRPRTCDLSEAKNEQDFWAAICSSLGIGPARGKSRPSSNTAVTRALSARGQGLLVLDDVEGIADCLARAVVDWIAAV